MKGNASLTFLFALKIYALHIFSSGELPYLSCFCVLAIQMLSLYLKMVLCGPGIHSLELSSLNCATSIDFTVIKISPTITITTDPAGNIAINIIIMNISTLL